MEINSALAVGGLSIAAISVGITAWMAVETRRMAIAALKALDLEQAPILGLRDIRVELGVNEGKPELTAIRVGLDLFNAGRVAVRYAVTSLEVTFPNSTRGDGLFLSRGGSVLPGGSAVFWHPTLVVKPPLSEVPAIGRIMFEFEYSDETARQSRSVSGAVEYTISRGPTGWHSGWLHVDEPA